MAANILPSGAPRRRLASLEEKWFDVPDEEYGAGNLTGYHIAAEFMQKIKVGSSGAFYVFEAACRALDD